MLDAISRRIADIKTSPLLLELEILQRAAKELEALAPLPLGKQAAVKEVVINTLRKAGIPLPISTLLPHVTAAGITFEGNARNRVANILSGDVRFDCIRKGHDAVWWAP